MKKRLRIIPILIILVLIGAAVYNWSQQAAAKNGPLAASGTIEATDVTISPELAGRVNDVLVDEGDHIQAGQELIHIDATLLQAQLKQAQASLAAAKAQHDAAQANYALLKSGAQQQQIDAAQQAVNAAQANVTNTLATYAVLKAGPRSAEIAAAEALVAQTAQQVKIAQDTYDKVTQCFSYKGRDICPGLGTPEEQARANLNTATEAHNAAQVRLDQLKSGATSSELAASYAKVNVAKAQQDQAQAQLELVVSGARPEQLAASQAQIDATQAQMDVVQAQIDALQVQIGKLTLKAPIAGTVLKRAIEPGEVVMPGASLLVVGDIVNLYMTVYIPESRYGEVKLGQTVQVSVDSFPDQKFSATVKRIADQAEFTPRNVQTAEGRATTVFAVRLEVTNPDGKLKPGMPADVSFAAQ
jgi:multidrug resistance efflux pump